MITHIVGARPNFMKAAPVRDALEAVGFAQRLVHTGQHYDRNMSEVFFDELGIPEPDTNLGIGSDTHARQTAATMVALEDEFRSTPPTLVLVYGDVNSTVAASLVAAKLGLPIGHVEAGLRSRDRRMPEEVNRLLTDQLASLLFTPSVEGNENLAREGVDPSKVHFVGNVMIDTLVRLRPRAERAWQGLSQEHKLSDHGYTLVTLHRPSTVDNPDVLRAVLGKLNSIAERSPVLFPLHPRTRQRIADAGLSESGPITYIDPVGYLDFLALQAHSQLVITDSGGVQEETTFIGVPCLTVRENTERPVTVTIGTNRLVGFDIDLLGRLVEEIQRGEAARGGCPILWDGRAGERIAGVLLDWADGRRG